MTPRIEEALARYVGANIRRAFETMSRRALADADVAACLADLRAAIEEGMELARADGPIEEGDEGYSRHDYGYKD